MSPARILVVAADRRVRTAVSSLLLSDAAVRVVLVEPDPARARRRLLAGGTTVDLVLVDLGRAPEAALELVAAISPRVPVVVLGFDEAARGAALAAGAERYLPATAGADELLGAVRSGGLGGGPRGGGPVAKARPGAVLGFGVAAFAGPWLVWGTRSAEARGLLGWHLPQGVALWSMTVPLLVAVAALWGRAGLRDLAARTVRVRVPAWTWAVALGLPVGVAGSSALLLALAGHPVGMGADLSLPDALAYLGLGTFLYLLTEEAAWRGVLLPRVRRRMGPGPAGLLVGAVWALWHVPLLSVPGEHDRGLPLAGFAVLVVATSVLMTVLVDAARGSLLVAALFHASFNASYSFFGVVGADRAAFWTVTAVSVLAAAVVLVRVRHVGAAVDDRVPSVAGRASDPATVPAARVVPVAAR